MKHQLILLATISLLISSCKNDAKQPEVNNEASKTITKTVIKPEVKIIPINHATLVLEYEDGVIYVDPVGGADMFKEQKPPQIILVTDIHGDHLNIETLEAITTKNTLLIVPKAVAEKLPETLIGKVSVLENGEIQSIKNSTIDFKVKAIPMYNLREEALKFHSKGRGNGYVITLGEKEIYISGDTEDIPEMRALKNIDIAFVCMNLPYTMTVESAASAVLEFKPKQVYPYHYRGTEGLSDVNEFKKIVNKGNDNIKVILKEWY
ncbi:MBL fold metallo-hydrolase [Lacinutrix undariae]